MQEPRVENILDYTVGVSELFFLLSTFSFW
jgi:hypothetical protein